MQIKLKTFITISLSVGILFTLIGFGISVFSNAKGVIQLERRTLLKSVTLLLKDDLLNSDIIRIKKAFSEILLQNKSFSFFCLIREKGRLTYVGNLEYKHRTANEAECKNEKNILLTEKIVNNNGIQIGTVRLGFNNDLKSFQNYIDLNLISFLVVTLFLVFILAQLISRKIIKEASQILNEGAKSRFLILDFDKLYDSVATYKEKAKSAVAAITIANTTQMLAHDVRKPFSLIKLILNSLHIMQKNPSKLETAKRDVEKAITNVESMVNDIMDFSREVKLKTDPNSLIEVIDYSIRQTIQSTPYINVEFEYDLEETFLALIDKDRMARVLTNIITNGIEAIFEIGGLKTGTITISTTSLPDNKIQLIIGNNGPLIPEGVIKNLFESFYTSGKRKGTGIGLSSAKKIINLHDGIIFARNKKDNDGVEFVINLQSVKELDTFNLSSLPKNGQAIISTKEDQENLEFISSMMKEENKKLKILLLDDEVLYRAWVKNLVDQNKTLKNIITFYDATTVKEALELVQNEKPDLAIVDLDLNDVHDGYTFLEKVQGIEYLASIVHSNRTISDYKKRAFELGAIDFIAKPLPLATLVKFFKEPQYKASLSRATINQDTACLNKEDLLPKDKVKENWVYCCDDNFIIRDHLNILLNQYLEIKPK